jgi:tetratricopeptide (TPR) repeat protein
METWFMNAAAASAPIPDSELIVSREQAPLFFPPAIPSAAQVQLLRMFRDPYLLEPSNRADLIADLRDAVALSPETAELRVLLGMALCVNLEAQEALEELRESVRLAPDSFIAHLKLGELLMRLRVCDQAAEETRMASELASGSLQSELARRQAATIRAMQRQGIERGGYGKLLSVFGRLPKLLSRAHPGRRRAALEA